MRPVGWAVAAMGALCHSEQKPFSHRGRAVTRKEVDVVRDNKEIRRSERQAEVSKEELRVSSFEARFASF